MDSSPASVSLQIIESRNDVDMVAVARALQPDNLRAPKDIKIACEPVDDETLVCNIEVSPAEDPTKILTLRNTFDDLIINMKAAIDSLAKASKFTR